jgi:transposase
MGTFRHLPCVPLSILYDNLKVAVARILGDGKRQRTRAFTELVSHYLFQERFGRPGKGNDKIPWGLPPAMLPVLARWRAFASYADGVQAR